MRKKKDGRGGARPGAGRPSTGGTKVYTFRVHGDTAKIIDEKGYKSTFFKECIIKAIAEKEPDFSFWGTAVPATNLEDISLPVFDAKIVAGFPVPLDNDEKAQNIELLNMLCPNPESCYLIRVQGDSMIDAGINSGDIVIVDKSVRNPSKSQIAVCEFNGEYTLKRFVMREGCGWLIPANPNFPEIRVTEEDSFNIWGIVTYIIHKPH